MKRLGALLVLAALPVAANVARPQPPARLGAELKLPVNALALPKAPAKPGAKPEAPAERVLDGLTVVELDAGSQNPHRVVLKPDFKGGPVAAFSVKF